MLSINEIKNNTEYKESTILIASLSRLFSESNVPFLQYRVAERLFCSCMDAEDLSRSDGSFDAKMGKIGVGIKTFQCSGNKKTEKVAEFNSKADELRQLTGKDLAIRLSELRNLRIQADKDFHGLESSFYHLVTRKEGKLRIFHTPYESINISNLTGVKENSKSLKFNDGKNHYSFNKSKSTLFKTFILPDEKDIVELSVKIIEDPLSQLQACFLDNTKNKARTTVKLAFKEKAPSYPSVILPLYSTKSKEGEVPERSGLNQWNAKGRPRDVNEVYIPIPRHIHTYYPGFFPTRDELFNLHLPTGDVFSAKVCQSGSKALMTNPNKAIAEWLLRKVLRIPERHVATRKNLLEANIDCVEVFRIDENNFKITQASYGSYETFKQIEE
jgi:hypothetical protein